MTTSFGSKSFQLSFSNCLLEKLMNENALPEMLRKPSPSIADAITSALM